MDLFFFLGGGGEEIAIFWHPQTRITIYIYITYPISRHGDIRKDHPLNSKVAGRWAVTKTPRIFTQSSPASSAFFCGIFAHFVFKLEVLMDMGLGGPFYRETFREDRRLRKFALRYYDTP